RQSRDFCREPIALQVADNPLPPNAVPDWRPLPAMLIPEQIFGARGAGSEWVSFGKDHRATEICCVHQAREILSATAHRAFRQSAKKSEAPCARNSSFPRFSLSMSFRNRLSPVSETRPASLSADHSMQMRDCRYNGRAERDHLRPQ